MVLIIKKYYAAMAFIALSFNRSSGNVMWYCDILESYLVYLVNFLQFIKLYWMIVWEFVGEKAYKKYICCWYHCGFIIWNGGGGYFEKSINECIKSSNIQSKSHLLKDVPWMWIVWREQKNSNKTFWCSNLIIELFWAWQSHLIQFILLNGSGSFE